MKKISNYSNLVTELASLVEQGRKMAVRYVNNALVVTYWFMGRRIVEYEQKGKERAVYGEVLLKKLSTDLMHKFGKGFTERNLEHMRQFYLTYREISHTMRAKLPKERLNEKPHSMCAESGKREEITNQRASCNELSFSKNQPLKFQIPSLESFATIFPLSWSHYRLLMRLAESTQREFYEAECITGNWSVRQLDRQIQSMLYERTALSKRKLSVISKAHRKPIVLKPEDEIKDPYILEFLGLKDEYSESQLEEALIKHLESFLLELGVGFTFIARQKRITIEGRHFRIDLLLYHRVLKCLVAIDLKVGEFTHADAGQMNLYLNYLNDKEKMKGENDTVGLILCTDAKKTLVEYALGNISNRIFTSRYKLQLPKIEILKVEIEREKQRLLEMKYRITSKVGGF